MRRNTKKVALGALILGLMMCTAVGCDNANEKSEYNVYKSADASYTVSGENVAKAGEDYTFTVTPKAGYDASEMKVVVNGKEIKAVDGKYTVSAVSDSLAIYVSGVKAPETEYVDVSFSGDHVDFTGEAKAEKGKDYAVLSDAAVRGVLGVRKRQFVRNGVYEIRPLRENGVRLVR